jgi:Na+/H+ antiporter NhaD/arsenite permease-like protein
VTRQLFVWVEWIVVTAVVLWLVVGLTVTAGPLVAAVIIGPALVLYTLGEQEARKRGSSVWRRSWSAAALFLALYLLVGWVAIVAALVVGAFVLVRARRAGT